MSRHIAISWRKYTSLTASDTFLEDEFERMNPY